MRNIQRMDLWIADLGKHYGRYIEEGVRPVLVISNDMSCRHAPMITVAPISSRIKRLYLPGHVILSCDDVDGRFRTGTVLLEQMTTIDKKQVKTYIGRIINMQRINAINSGILDFLGVSDDTRRIKE